MNTASLHKNTSARFLLPFFGKSNKTLVVGNHKLSIDEVASVALYGAQVCITDSEAVLRRVQAPCDAMLLRINSHLHGASGIRLELIRRMERFLNAGVTPHVYEFGSIGASGDLVSLSYITGSLTGMDRSRAGCDVTTASTGGVDIFAPQTRAKFPGFGYPS